MLKSSITLFIMWIILIMCCMSFFTVITNPIKIICALIGMSTSITGVYLLFDDEVKKEYSKIKYRILLFTFTIISVASNILFINSVSNLFKAGYSLIGIISSLAVFILYNKKIKNERG